MSSFLSPQECKTCDFGKLKRNVYERLRQVAKAHIDDIDDKKRLIAKNDQAQRDEYCQGCIVLQLCGARPVHAKHGNTFVNYYNYGFVRKRTFSFCKMIQTHHLFISIPVHHHVLNRFANFIHVTMARHYMDIMFFVIKTSVSSVQHGCYRGRQIPIHSLGKPFLDHLQICCNKNPNCFIWQQRQVLFFRNHINDIRPAHSSL